MRFEWALRTELNVSRQENNMPVAIVMAIFVVGYSVAGLYAAFASRGLYADGVYFLVKVYELKDLYLVEGARRTVQAIQRAPTLALRQLTTMELADLGIYLSMSMLLAPILFCVVCWPILPSERKPWIIFPLLHVAIGVSASSFATVGEGAIAASYFWPLLFLLMFRTRLPGSQALFLLLCLPAFWLHEGAVILMPVLLIVCAIRFKEASGIRERVFLAACALLIASIIFYDISWIVWARRPDQRSAYLASVLSFSFVAIDGRVNLPVVNGALALAALSIIALLEFGGRAVAVPKRAWLVANSFACVAVLSILCAWFWDATFAPVSQFLARNHAIFVSVPLGLAAIAAIYRPELQRVLARGPTLSVVLALCSAQLAWDVAATHRWRSYVADFQARLAMSAGLIPWEQTLHTSDLHKDRDWRLLTWQWTMPLMSIVLADSAHIRSMIGAPVGVHWQPFDPAKPNTLPKLHGIDYSLYVSALGASKK
jgi:hypothetical protein